ncbi:hypothetical protein PC113_g18303 [Phytophthora cactorum]|nr:hypothetical protein PC113_g18303 [Phytophthora cactorum]KAG3060186.1 hypothetical protein PC121_g13605 [Phytophthora cactorum]KAG3065409.1 hypothetical protein PC122_g18128 [Phytophthora cactorum]
MLIATLCYLAGGSYFDIRRIVGISRPSYCRVVDLTMTAIISQSELQIRFPKSDSEKEIVMADFREKKFWTNHEWLRRLCQIKSLSVKDAGNGGTGNISVAITVAPGSTSRPCVTLTIGSL